MEFLLNLPRMLVLAGGDLRGATVGTWHKASDIESDQQVEGKGNRATTIL